MGGAPGYFSFWSMIWRVMPYVSKLLANRNLLKNLVIRDLKTRYIGSVGGFVWSVVHPLVSLVSYSFVFTVVMPTQLRPEDGTSSFPIFLFCGLLPWILFSDTVMRSCSVVVDNSALITKTIIPAEILPIAITISNLVHHLIGLGVLFAVLVIFHSVHISALGILIYLPILVLLAQGLGWMVAGLQVFLRDTLQALQILMVLWFWFTPVIYNLDRLPDSLSFLAVLNPMAIVITGYRNALLDISQPSLAQVAVVFATAVAVFILGGLIFKQAKPGFADVL
jgi:lipopolysaccharide transport system permease protein